MIPDYENNSLMLAKNGEIIHSSMLPGLKALVSCIDLHQGKVDECELYDRVIGLAAARLIAYSGIIARVSSPVVSKPAKDYLEKVGIPINAGVVVDNIMMKDKSDICPMEKKALAIDNDESFYLELKNMMLK